jgi:hypothetical protein
MSRSRHTGHKRLAERPKTTQEPAPLDFWQEPHFRALQTKIGQDLGVLLPPPKELPHRMLTLLLQISEEPEE